MLKMNSLGDRFRMTRFLKNHMKNRKSTHAADDYSWSKCASACDHELLVPQDAHPVKQIIINCHPRSSGRKFHAGAETTGRLKH